MRPENATVEHPDDLTSDWLTAAIGSGRISGFTVERIGTGQMSDCYRIWLNYQTSTGNEPASVILKVSATDPTSRQTGLALGLYEREVRFYSEIGPTLVGPIARCHHASFDSNTGAFALLIDDAAPATAGDELRGASLEQARLALTELARMHSQLLGKDLLAEASWLKRSETLNQAMISQLFVGFLARYGAAISAEQRTICQRLVESFDAYLAAETGEDRSLGLVHGDYRLDNMLFGQPGSPRNLTVVDWQTVNWGPAMTDVAYFIGCALPVDARRDHYDELLRAYYEGLSSEPQMSFADLRESVRRQSFAGVMMAIISSMLVERTERGDQMFLAMLERHTSHVLDTDALATLPTPSVPVALRPDPSGEIAHPAGDEPLWSESWYWDFADAAQGIGGWLRLGLIPNQNVAWINVVLCGPDMPTVALLDFHAPLPSDAGVIITDDFEMRHAATDPLHRYRVHVAGTGLAYANPADLLQDKTGEPTNVALDLVWDTVGTPYQYRITTRYEIPCLVSGALTIGGYKYHLAAVAGQRDHSHGVRDWWSMDWVWSALHLDDGTHLHGVDIRIAGMPPVSVGYIQSSGEPVLETATVAAEASFADDGLPLTTSIAYCAGAGPSPTVDATIDIRGHAPVRLVSPDGRVSEFPRAWAVVETADGRRGVGWVEWNRNI